MNKTVICQNCNGRGFISGGDDHSIWSKTCDVCYGSGMIEVPMTNADKIRAMSDEDLADFIAKTIIVHINDTLTTLCVPRKVAKGSKERAEAQCLEWLKQPAEE